MELKHRKISELKAAEYNPRKISPERFDDLRKSLREDPEFFELRPCIVNMRAGRENVVIAGNQRMEAAHAEGWEEVPCFEVDVPKEKEEIWNIKDNNQYGEWNRKLLVLLLKDLQAQGISASETGISKQEMATIVDSFHMASDDKFDAQHEYEKITKAESKRGEVYQLGPHRLMCGDSTDAKDVEKLMGGGPGADDLYRPAI